MATTQPTKTALAKEAGISITTLNRFLAGGKSSPETEDAIIQAAAKISYQIEGGNPTPAPTAPTEPTEPRPALPPEAELPAVKEASNSLGNGRTYEILTVAQTGKPRATPSHTHTLIIKQPIAGGNKETKFALDYEPTLADIKRMAG